MATETTPMTSPETEEPPLPTAQELQMRHVWCWINIACCLWSFLLVVEIIYTLDPTYQIEGTQEYLFWSFGTTAIWCAEVGHHVYVALGVQGGKIGYRHIIEGALAVYFLIESVFLLRTWNNPEYDFTGELLEASLTTIGYGYMAWYTSDFYGPARQEESSTDESSTDEPESPYQELV